MPSYGIGYKEFLGMPVWLSDELQELLEESRDATLDALKGKVPLDQAQGIPRKKVDELPGD